MVVLAGSYCKATQCAPDSPFLQLAINFLNLEFLAGCFVAVLVTGGHTRYPVPARVLGVLAAASTLLLPVEWDRALLYLLPAALIVYGSVALEARWGTVFPRWLRFVGDMSYSVYLSHMLVLSATLKIVRSFESDSPVVTHALFLGLGGLGVLAVGAFSYFWIEKPLLTYAYAVVPRLVDRMYLPGRRRKPVPAP